jgi:putative hydrolase of HD superfamily
MSKQLRRIEEQFAFLIEADRLKNVLRRVSTIYDPRKENSAEHSWHVILLALTLAEHSNEPIDLLRVVRMLAIHDIVEIDAGDTFHYHKTTDTSVAEHAAARRIFGLLPEDQQDSYLALWREFEDRQTPEAKFAAAVDRIWPVFQNIAHHGGTWKEFKISLKTALEKNAHVTCGSQAIWEHVAHLLRQADVDGLFHQETSVTEDPLTSNDT